MNQPGLYETYDAAREEALRNEAVNALRTHGIGHEASRAACQAWRDHAELRIDEAARNDPSANIYFALERAKILGDAGLYDDAFDELDDAETMAQQQGDNNVLESIERGRQYIGDLYQANEQSP